MQLRPIDGYTRRNGTVEPPPLVGRPGASGELGSTIQTSDRHSTTMVHVLGSSGDSGFHREFYGENVEIKTEPGIKAPEAEVWLAASETKGSADNKSLVGALVTRNSKSNIYRSIWKRNLAPY